MTNDAFKGLHSNTTSTYPNSVVWVLPGQDGSTLMNFSKASHIICTLINVYYDNVQITKIIQVLCFNMCTVYNSNKFWDLKSFHPFFLSIIYFCCGILIMNPFTSFFNDPVLYRIKHYASMYAEIFPYSILKIGKTKIAKKYLHFEKIV